MRSDYLFTSESVSEGHPDKVADQISDTVVDLFLSKDPEARIACETTGLDVIRIVQRGLGLAGFLRSNEAERVMRDLAAYLRQPAPDETLTEAAAWFTRRDLPDPETA